MACRNNLAKIHIAKKELGLDDDIYRDILHTQFKKASSRDLSDFQCLKLLQHFESLGWKQAEGKKRNYGKRPNNMDSKAAGKAGNWSLASRARQLEKIEALLTVGKKSWDYADGIAKRICKVDKVQWVEDCDLYKIISALVYQGKRQGWDITGAWG